MSMESNTIESKVASTILERPTGEIIIAGKKYLLPPPTLATLILVSEIVATLPIVQDTKDPQEKIMSALHYAKDYKKLADICAILILGAKNLIEVREKTITKKRFFGLWKRTEKITETINRQKELADEILLHLSPSEIFNNITKRLKENEVGIFFLITTSLSEANLIKPTKEVVN